MKNEQLPDFKRNTLAAAVLACFLACFIAIRGEYYHDEQIFWFLTPTLVVAGITFVHWGYLSSGLAGLMALSAMELGADPRHLIASFGICGFAALAAMRISEWWKRRKQSRPAEDRS